MRNLKHAPKRKGAKAVPVLGAAGLLSLAGGASAATALVADLPTQKIAPNHEIILGEEELSDVSLSNSLSTFHVFDKASGEGSAWRQARLAGMRRVSMRRWLPVRRRLRLATLQWLWLWRLWLLLLMGTLPRLLKSHYV